jgi:adenylosuccinate lyase
VLRGYLLAGFEDVALWHERDISHSSVERIVLPDATLAAYYAVKRMTRLVDGLVVHADRMSENLLDGSYGLVFSQPVLLSLVRAGLARDAAYRIVQRDARRAIEERRGFREVLEKDPDVEAALGGALPEVLAEAFDLGRALAHAGRTIDALAEVPETLA